MGKEDTKGKETLANSIKHFNSILQFDKMTV